MDGRGLRTVGAIFLGLASCGAARAADTFSGDYAPLNLMQIVNPADKAQRPEGERAETSPPPSRHVPTSELPAIKVVGQKPSELREEDRVGSYEQPRWTADRRFTGTRTYVIPENKIEFEYWLKPQIPKHGATEYESLYELEVGLPHRFQLDLYFRQNWEANGGKRFSGESIEVRYALADWGKIWGNPSLYLEYTFLDSQPDLIEGKLLLTGELAPRWHWGFNFSFESEISGQRGREYELTGGLSYTVIDEKLSIGAEFEGSLLDDKTHRGDFDKELKIGPSIQWRPIPRMHVDFAPLIGVTNQSPAVKIYLVIGFEF
jgi:hypothetical protein